MSAQPVHHAVDDAPPTSGDRLGAAEPAATVEPFEVRRNPVVSGVIGAAAAAMGTAYLWRAIDTGRALDWVLCVLLGGLAVVFLRSLLDSRTPLLVVDELGARIRLGATWRGLPWEAVDRVVVTPRRGPLRDGRLLVHLHDAHRAVEGLDGRALRHARLNRRAYGGALAVPLGPTTRVTGGDEGALGDRVTALSRGRAEVVTLLDTPGPVARTAPPAPQPAASPAAPAAPETPERAVIDAQPAPEADRRPRWLRRSAETTAAEEPAGAPDEESASRAGDGSVARAASDRALEHPAGGARGTVRPIARLAAPVDPLVIGDFEPQPAYDPVIGPELAAARTRVGLSVDELAERTRIRPHVIESIEVDDFAPCGGDFYARGHIRTLARVLGKAPEPLLAQFEARYASAPVTAKRVFEAELATGLTGTIRGTGQGGPNWALLMAVVLAVVLVWSGVRLFAGESDRVLETPPPVLNGSAGLGNVYGQPRTSSQPQPVRATVTAVNAGTHVEVRDGEGQLVFEGDLVIGESEQVDAEPPLTVSSDNGGAVTVTMGERDLGFLGAPDQPATKVFQRP